MRESFGSRLGAAMAGRGPLCVGIDPHPGLLEAWGLPVDVHGLERFALTCVEALAGEVAVIKPQCAFFEAYGSRGIAVLERVITEAQQAGALVLVDAKRGDIGSTMSAYARAFLAEGAPLAADAVTLSPYPGFAALAPALELAEDTGRGVFVLALTSNPEARAVQHADAGGGRSVAQSIVDEAALRNAARRRHTGSAIGDTGVVVGATVEPAALDLDSLYGPVLAPGFGAQGAGVRELRAVFGDELAHVLPASSRAVLRAGPEPAALRAAALRTRDEILAPPG